MKEHIRGLRQLGLAKHEYTSPYLLRTRFERNLYGVLVSVSASAFGKRINGPTESHVREFLRTIRASGMQKEREAMVLGARLFEKFTFLSDSSTWSDDGQDPRLELCRDDILKLCDLVESLTSHPLEDNAVMPNEASLFEDKTRKAAPRDPRRVYHDRLTSVSNESI
jgi:hypothetical protein